MLCRCGLSHRHLDTVEVNSGIKQEALAEQGGRVKRPSIPGERLILARTDPSLRAFANIAFTAFGDTTYQLFGLVCIPTKSFGCRRDRVILVTSAHHFRHKWT